MILLAISVFLCILLSTTVRAFSCMQCGGKVFEGDVRISWHHCCNPMPVVCSKGQVCLRAYVVAPDTTFFLSGCHTPDDGMIGCDQHKIVNNATVHRCTCMDEQCQSYFPGNCHKSHHPPHHRGHSSTTTTAVAPTTATVHTTAVPRTATVHTTTTTLSTTTAERPSISLFHPPKAHPRKGREDQANRKNAHSPLVAIFLLVFLLFS